MTIGWSRIGLAAMGAVFALLFALPEMVEDIFVLVQLSLFLIFSIEALSLALVWGFGGIFSFGQAAFFGLGGYTYAVLVHNIGDSTAPFLCGILVPTGFALLLGYFMFYGRISSVYVAVITLTVTLIFYKFLGHTAGYQYSIGKAHLGGFNGMPSVPPINLPGNPEVIVFPDVHYYLVVGFLLVIYFGLRWFLATPLGRVVIAVRENELRAELLGYDTRLVKMLTFGLGGAVAGVGGVLFVNWNAYISPTVFDLVSSAQVIIWVIVGGLGTLIGPILGAVGLGYLAIELGSRKITIMLSGAQHTVDINLILGAILLVFVLGVPAGVVPSLKRLARRLARLRPAVRAATPARADQVGESRQ